MPGKIVLPPQLSLHDYLCSNAGMVASGVPQSHLALHAMPSSECILDRIRQCVTKMQRPRDIRRWDDHHEFVLGRNFLVDKRNNVIVESERNEKQVCINAMQSRTSILGLKKSIFSHQGYHAAST